MKPEAIEQTRQKNAMQHAMEQAKARPKAPQKPGVMPTRKAPRFKPQTPEAAFEALRANIRVRHRHGLLELSKSAAQLVIELGATDQKELALAMVREGFCRVHRGVSGEVFFTVRGNK